MLKLSGLVKKEQFEFTDLDSTTHKLEVSEYTVADVKKLIELQEPIIGDNNLSIAEQSEMIIGSRIVCAVKVQGTPVHFWNTIAELTEKGYPNDLINALYPIVNNLNPINTESLDEKKTES